jgi:PRTRC genetic system protein E
MFTELAKVIQKGPAALSLNICREDEQRLRVLVIPPKSEGDDKAIANAPVLVIGTPEDLDAQLGAQIANYEQARQESVNALEEAAKALKEETEAARKKTADTRARTAKAKQATAEETAKTVEKAQATAKESRTGEQLALATTESQGGK